MRYEDDHGDDVETGPRGIIRYHAHVQVDVPDKDHGKHPIIGTKESQVVNQLGDQIMSVGGGTK